MDATRRVTPGRLRRLSEELVDEGTGILAAATEPELLVDELDYALHPPRHEHRVPSYGAIVCPSRPWQEWVSRTGLDVTVSPLREPDDLIRRVADGRSSWLIRDREGMRMALLDRAAASERDLVLLAEATGGIMVQRRSDDQVRIVGSFGVARYAQAGWHIEPPFGSWLKRASCGVDAVDPDTLDRVLRFAVHDLGASGIGALIIVGTLGDGSVEQRMSEPPPLRLDAPSHLGPLRHVLSQVDGSAVFDRNGVLRQLGVRLIPSLEAETFVAPLGGTRHTSARRYSFDDPEAIVVTVSDSGPVTVFRNGEIIGRSEPESLPV